MRVMIVDDSASMRMIVRRTLKQTGHDDWEVCEAVDGVDALNKVDDYDPHLIFCDWNMPNMNGIDVLKNLRAKENAVKFGFVTTESTPEMRALAKEAGANFLIAKPFTAQSFSSAVGAVLGR